MFDPEYLKIEMEKLNELISDHVNLYLIGGGSMSFQNLKEATKDIDVVVRSKNDMDLIRFTLTRMGYSIPAIRGPYKQMQASLIMENQDSFSNLTPPSPKNINPTIRMSHDNILPQIRKFVSKHSDTMN